MGDVNNGKAVLVWGQGVYGKPLLFTQFAVDLKLLEENKDYFQLK